MKKLKKTLCAFLSVCMIALPAVSSVTVSAESIDSLQQQLQELEKQNEQYEKELEKTKSDIDDKEKYSETLLDKIGVLDEKIAVTNQSIEKLDEQIEDKQKEIDESNNQMDEQIKTLSNRLRIIYMAGNASDIEIILGAKDFSDFIDKVQLVRTITNYDKGLINQVNETLDEVTQQKAELEDSKAEVEEQRLLLQNDVDELNTLVEENKKTLEELYETKEKTEKSMEEAVIDSEEVEAKIKQYYKELAQSSGGTASDIKVSASGFTWPSPGCYTLTSLWNEDRTTYNHGAIDIGTPTGTQIVAAYKGTVIDTYNGCRHNYGKSAYCGCGGGYGNYVMIDHGNGKMTIYGHLTQGIVNVGDKVETGQTIGYAGSTGNSTGPHLHFECRLYGVKYNPMLEFE